uniref:Uncharacterized protein n=1 Tax=Chromera velia CCMP2878 TaxID=1169474 RepID=A0A0G4HDD4_9ALVE|eukprot:Cvel_26462.t1-p1 / transcript=Cvel_26462.t1 / gene=Cvel_26462 / organism=Chromera_velia_CCMP2878 / gene_product=hypothetical protein / transcript_product=hypothetical protein / location=Cvel_scaffold3148:116-433(-) / protein_length=106 / sequence_SO=supercontig / SO=protein_coding / is_pseudo=false
MSSLPVVSQLVSLAQASSGDAEGAKETQRRFLDGLPVISQMKSLVQAIGGDAEGAKETQERFAECQEAETPTEISYILRSIPLCPRSTSFFPVLSVSVFWRRLLLP